MWVGPQILEEKICIFGKKLVGPENAEEKKRYLWKKFGGWVPNDTRNKFSAYVPQIFAWPPLTYMPILTIDDFKYSHLFYL